MKKHTLSQMSKRQTGRTVTGGGVWRLGGFRGGQNWLPDQASRLSWTRGTKPEEDVPRVTRVSPVRVRELRDRGETWPAPPTPGLLSPTSKNASSLFHEGNTLEIKSNFKVNTFP